MKFKNSMLASGIALALLSTAANAQQLRINNVTVPGAQIQTFSLSGNVLHITTKNGESIGLVGGVTDPDTNPGAGTGDGDGDGGDGTPEPVDPGDGGGTPSTPGSCVPGAKLVCGFDIDWTSSSSAVTRTQIPAGGTILASEFKTTQNSAHQVTLFFQPPAGWAFSQVEFWISKEAGGDIGNAVTDCVGGFAVEGMLKVYQREKRGCSLETNTSYFLNMRHIGDKSPAHYVNRKQSTFGS